MNGTIVFTNLQEVATFLNWFNSPSSFIVECTSDGKKEEWVLSFTENE